MRTLLCGALFLLWSGCGGDLGWAGTYVGTDSVNDADGGVRETSFELTVVKSPGVNSYSVGGLKVAGREVRPFRLEPSGSAGVLASNERCTEAVRGNAQIDGVKLILNGTVDFGEWINEKCVGPTLPFSYSLRRK